MDDQTKFERFWFPKNDQNERRYELNSGTSSFASVMLTSCSGIFGPEDAVCCG